RRRRRRWRAAVHPGPGRRAHDRHPRLQIHGDRTRAEHRCERLRVGGRPHIIDVHEVAPALIPDIAADHLRPPDPGPLAAAGEQLRLGRLPVEVPCGFHVERRRGGGGQAPEPEQRAGSGGADSRPVRHGTPSGGAPY
ncbi:MAG: hypothetical protein ACK55I_06505, partial [bacterium]